LTMPILYDSRGVAKERYGAKTLPRLYVVDKYRTIRLAKKGFAEGEDFEGEVSAVIEKLLAEEWWKFFVFSREKREIIK